MEFCDLYKRAMLMSDTGGDAGGGGGGGGRGAERLMGQAVDALRDSEWGEVRAGFGTRVRDSEWGAAGQ